MERGLTEADATSGVGLVTRGAIWEAHEIWFYPQNVDGVATGWIAAAGYSGCAMASLVTTSWSASAGYSGGNAASLITTPWTPSKFGLFGEVPP